MPCNDPLPEHQIECRAPKICPYLTQVEERLTKGSEQMKELREVQKSIMAQLAANSADTAEVLEIVHAGKGFFKLAGYIGTFIKWSSAVVISAFGAWTAWKHGVKL